MHSPWTAARSALRVSLAVVTVLAVAAGAGCATIGRAAFKAPVVTLRNVTITGLGLQGGNLDVVLSVYNPNHYRLDALRMTYNVDVDSVPVGIGALDRRFSVPSGDSSIVRLPVNFTYNGLGAAGSALLRQGILNYRVHGDFTVGTPVGNFTRPYDQKGRYSAVKGGSR
jgi:LEA14-like dessication related protein